MPPHAQNLGRIDVFGKRLDAFSYDELNLHNPEALIAQVGLLAASGTPTHLRHAYAETSRVIPPSYALPHLQFHLIGGPPNEYEFDDIARLRFASRTPSARVRDAEHLFSVGNPQSPRSALVIPPSTVDIDSASREEHNHDR